MLNEWPKLGISAHWVCRSICPFNCRRVSIKHFIKDSRNIPWRGDSGLKDGCLEQVDLQGGWYHGSDYIKHGLPTAAAATVMLWGLVDYKDAYISTGEYEFGKKQVKWIIDYYMKAHVSKYELYVQVSVNILYYTQCQQYLGFWLFFNFKFKTIEGDICISIEPALRFCFIDILKLPQVLIRRIMGWLFGLHNANRFRKDVSMHSNATWISVPLAWRGLQLYNPSPLT